MSQNVKKTCFKRKQDFSKKVCKFVIIFYNLMHFQNLLYSGPKNQFYIKLNFSTKRTTLVFFSVNLCCPLFLRLSERKVLVPNGPYTSTSQTKIRNVGLSGNFRILSAVVVVVVYSIARLQPKPAYIKAWNIN